MPAYDGKLSQEPTKHGGKGKVLSLWDDLSAGKPRVKGGPGWPFPAPSYRTATMQREADLGEAGLRGAICDESQDVAHVHGVGLQVGVGQAVGFLALQHLLVIVHEEDAPLHADQVAQVGGSIVQTVRVFLGQRGRVEVCKTGLSDCKVPLTS